MILNSEHLQFIQWVRRYCTGTVGCPVFPWTNHNQLSEAVPGMPQIFGGFSLHWSPATSHIIYSVRHTMNGVGKIRPFIVITQRGGVRVIRNYEIGSLFPLNSRDFHVHILSDIIQSCLLGRDVGFSRQLSRYPSGSPVQGPFAWYAAYDLVRGQFPSALPPISTAYFLGALSVVSRTPVSRMGVHPCKAHRKLKPLPLP